MDRTFAMNRREILSAAAAVAVGTALGGKAWAQGYPSRPIRWVCYQAAGGSMDITMRAYQPFLEKQGLEMQLDYIVGGSGNIARTEVFGGVQDGYTIMTDTAPASVLNEVVAEAPYKALEFQPILGWALEGWQIYTRKENDIRTAEDLIAASKQRLVTVASIGRGSTSHLQLLTLQEALGIKLNIVHFSGSAQVLPQVIGGNVDVAIGGPGSAVRSADQIQVIGLIRESGEPALPDVPTFASQGYKVEAINQTWYASTGPGVPPDSAAKLTEAFAAAYDDPGFAEAQNKVGFIALQKLMPDDIRAINTAAFDLANTYKSVLTSE